MRLICVLLISLVVPSRAEVLVVQDAADWAVFGNGKRTLKVAFRNTGDQAVDVNLGYPNSTVSIQGEFTPVVVEVAGEFRASVMPIRLHQAAK